MASPSPLKTIVSGFRQFNSRFNSELSSKLKTLISPSGPKNIPLSHDAKSDMNGEIWIELGELKPAEVIRELSPAEILSNKALAENAVVLKVIQYCSMQYRSDVGDDINVKM